LIDEFQDFSALEVEFIKQLESHGNILIVGDDDQAIYDKKFDLGKSLRDLYYSDSYEHFELPYCNRCPKVIVDSVNDIVKEAIKQGYLKERINKKFIAYEKGKENINNNYPKLQIFNMASVAAASCYLDCFIKTIINEEIDNYEKREGREPLILIISNGKYLKIFKKYYENKLKNIADYIEPDQDKEDKNLHICEAYKILLKEEEANIGWRLLLYYDRLQPPELEREILEESKKNIPLVELIPDEYKQKHQEIINLIGKLKNSTEYTNIQIEKKLENLVDISLKEQIIEFFTNKKDENLIKAQDKIYPIQFVTYQGSKGLAADYVFILGMNDGDLPKDPSSITDYEICEFIVGLTRAKKYCYIIPINNVFGIRMKKSTFLSWIENERINNYNSLSVKQVRQIFNDKSDQH
jgi:superfamily I DNA/RNA helicase